MQRKVGAKVIIVEIVGELIRERLAEGNTGLICPATSNVSYSVTTTTQDEQGDVEFAHVFHRFGVSSSRDVEAAETISGERVSAASVLKRGTQ